MPQLAFNVLLVAEEDGTWTAICLDLEGCMSQGATQEEAMNHIADAIKLNIEYLQSEGIPIPSAKMDVHGGAISIPGVQDIQTEYPHLDAQMYHGKPHVVLV